MGCFSSKGGGGGSRAVDAVAEPEEAFDASDLKRFKVDASANGCSGMFWRASPNGKTSSASDWPRNGTEIKGWKSKVNPGWVRVDHPEKYWLPMSQHGKPVVHALRD